MRALIRAVLQALARLYFPTIVVQGRDRVPAQGPVVFVLNHPNALMDPVVLRLALGRPVRFLAKSTLFGNPAGRAAMEAFGAIPVYRSQDVRKGAPGPRGVGDGGGPGAGTPAAALPPHPPADDPAARNEKTFALCRTALAAGDSLALFPEGTSHSDPRLKPLKTGAARIALGAEREHAGALGLRVVPVGLLYEQKTVFRSRALLVVGEPLVVAEHLPAFERDERAGIEALTEAIRAGLEAVVLEAETRDVLEGVAHVAVWTAQGPGARDDLAARRARARALLDAYRVLRERDPGRIDAVVASAREYASTLTGLGVSDPWALEVGRVRALPALAVAARLLALLPLAVLGAVMGWVPYRAAGIVAARYFRAEDVLGTVKLLGGALFLLLGWGLESAAAGLLWGWPWALGALVAGPVSGYAALRFSETVRVASHALRHLWLRGADPETTLRLVEHRKALAREVERALGDASAGDAQQARAAAAR